jgi:predicted nucleic acid-binding protein
LKFPVSNAGPLIALGRINHLHLLPELFGQVIVPQTVFAEVTPQVERPGAMQLKQATWLQIRAAQDAVAVKRLLLLLDQGESEAIILAQELIATLLMDERR